MPDKLSKSSGFTLVELAVTLTVLGMLLAFSVPAFNRINQSYQIKGSAENMAGTLRLWRERAISTGVNQEVHFHNLVGNSNWHIHSGSKTIWGGKFPEGVSLYTWTAFPRFLKDGRVDTQLGSAAGYWVLENRNGRRDTVSVLTSGLILNQ
jgi:prepilin-type N-terminal cleavage/methylation domain-containing protein